MQNDILRVLTHLSDTALIRQMRDLIGRERGATAELVAHLAELDTREVHLREGYPSLYIYCRDALGLSEWEAYNRIEVARAARRFPVILELLADGCVTITAVKLLAPHLTPENHGTVLQAARGKRKAQVEEMVARLAPRPDVPCSVRRLPTGVGAGETAPQSGDSAPVTDRARGLDLVAGLNLVAGSDQVAASSPSPATEPIVQSETALGDLASLNAGCALNALSPSNIASTTVTRAVVSPLSPDRYKLQLTIGAETLEKMRLAKDMLGHAVPSGDDAAVLDRAFTALLTELAKLKYAGTPKPRMSPPRTSPQRRSPPKTPGGAPPAGAMRTQAPRTPSAAVKRAVWVRDLGRCAFIATGGHRCSERRLVEFHHVDPYVLGGEASVDRIQLRCRRHNDYEGRLYFGQRRNGWKGRELVPEQVRLSAQHSTP